MIPEPCNTLKFLYARWSTFSGRFHTVSFTMQSHDQNSTSSLSLLSILLFAMAGSQWKRICLLKLWKCKGYFKQTELCHSLLIFPGMKGQKLNFLEIWFSLWNSDTARQTTFRFPLFKLILITHAWNLHYYELHQMKEKDLSFPNMCHLLIIIVIKLW